MEKNIGYQQYMYVFHSACNRTAVPCVTRFHPMAQCDVHALKGLACRARVFRLARMPRTANRAQRSRRLSSTHAAAPVLLAHAEVTKNINIFSMGPKLRYPTVASVIHEHGATVCRKFDAEKLIQRVQS